ncbi:MAG: type II toxin-antitoxin system VapC family toxin [Okeania sp. SIO3I5]|uniref:PIN domain-containing protein n=1 Tax=Okeania sp. SIO3I5 TaxID=2607805 RepID=UPI0013B93E6E|nr:PIN domain-containing protein [Okeania sp. SIO3I5]NEQ40615.1 type II toxin-antitoxin system VapC family toxin [Okeania sp. SIO3I5]
MIRVYLDTSVYNRPFDDQTQKKVALETEAVVLILEMIKNQEIELVNSKPIEYENIFNSDLSRQEKITNFLTLATIYQKMEQSEEKRAKQLQNQGIKLLDSYHVACAEASQSDYFITCDRRLINRCQTLSTIKTVNPINFITEVSYEN